MDQIVTYHDEHTDAALTVSAADSPREFQRWRLREQVKHQNGQYSGEASWLHLFAWPDMAVALAGEITEYFDMPESKEGERIKRTTTIDRAHPLPFDIYLAMPEPLVVQIEEALYSLNPQWVIKAESADSEKKGQTSSTGD